MSTSVEREPEDLHDRNTDPWSVPSSISDDLYTTGMQHFVPILADGDYGNPMIDRYNEFDTQNTTDNNEALDESQILNGDRLSYVDPLPVNQ